MGVNEGSDVIFTITRKILFNVLSKKFNRQRKPNKNFIDGEFEDIEDNDDRKI